MSLLKLPIVVILSLIISGCSLIGGQKNQAVTIKYWGLWDSAIVMNQIRQDYKKIKPNVDIIYEKKSPQQYRESLQAQINSTTGPDIFQFHNTWTQMLESELAPIPQSIISQSQFKDEYYPTIFNDLRNSNKEFVGAPLGIDGLGLYYNEDIFQAAGISQPPSSWQELANTVVKLTVRDTAGNIRTAGIALGSASNVDHFSDILALMILQNGGDLKNPVDARSADALEYYANFARGDIRVWDETMSPSTVAFTGGSLAMYLAPSWRAAEIKTANPLLKFKIAPVPQLEGGSVSWASYWAIGVSKKTKYQKEALEFLKYLQEDDTLIKLYSESAKTPGRIIGMPYPKKSLAQKLASDPLVGAYVSEAPFMRSFPMASRTFDNGLNDQIIKAYEDAVNEVLKGTPASNALETTAKNIRETLAKYPKKPQ
ncbi:hypothetical protein A3A49_00040 [Candidatus Curtissbacteria bacterium RIFCSPLOWO2_01_FULL_38_11b]|uniref:ABC transporter substrate-binding protein n=1 Tax=Candidatus Curtissbacteria bacterium RIFCSPLOWO2_01_FULL_38_11b TaxID=1797725 RepID=A0A1F5H256_9BACT|nr:MAG: hypothetical protein A3A49_00040 [Candidatus Curtissbacteria bacterium RIFCSPLOWO2_01_FULL_38_11b]